MQVYIVSGGRNGWQTNAQAYLTSTETFVKDTDTQWQIAANLPSGRHAHIGVGLGNGRFLVAGQDSEHFLDFFNPS